MSLKNGIHEGYTYFMTMTVVDWVDVFTRPVYKNSIVNALQYCQQAKGLEIYGWVLMTNHLHLMDSVRNREITMSDILRDFKKYTSKRIVEAVQAERESRRNWLLYRFEYAGKYAPKNKIYKFWQDGNEAKEMLTPEFYQQKLTYLHDNPVRAGIVEYPDEYLYSSARNYVRNRA